MLAKMLSFISTPYSNFQENDSKNQITTEQNSIIVHAIFINSFTLSNTSRATYFTLGNLYSWSSDINAVPLSFINNFLIIIADIKIIAIAKKYNDAETSPDLSAKKYPVNIAIIGNFALHGINGVSIIDSSLSLLSFIILVDIIAGTLHPKSNYKWY